MKYIFNKIENIEISNNCFLGSFVNMLKYYGIKVNEEQVQLLYKDNEKQTLVLLDNYLKLIEEEKNIYSLYLEENYE